MSGMILGCVLALPKRFVCRWLKDSRAVSFSLLKVPVQVFDTDMNVLANAIPR